MTRRLPRHAHAGDAGNDASVSVSPHDPRHFEAMVRQLMPEWLRAADPRRLHGAVGVWAWPRLGGLKIVMRRALEGAINASLGLGGHGKPWSRLVLRLKFDEA